MIFEAYRQVIRNELDAIKEVIFSTVSPVYFWRVISNCRRQEIPETIANL